MIAGAKTFARTRLPFLVPVWGRLRRASFLARCLVRSREDCFTAIYEENTWGDAASRSGPGSNLVETEAVRAALPGLVAGLGCATLLDVPCGDFFWMQHVDLPLRYLGADIVPELVRRNQAAFGNERREFLHLDLVGGSLPRVDLVFCRDCLVHLAYAAIFQAVANVRRSGATYLLTTTFREKANRDIITGSWRPLNLQAAPFHFPEPLQWIDEQCPQPGFADKGLGLWKVADLPGHG